MAQLTFEPASEYYDEPTPRCETRGCVERSTVHATQEHMDDGEGWALCTRHAAECAAEQMAWVAADGEEAVSA